jgi:hypothetical protein
MWIFQNKYGTTILGYLKKILKYWIYSDYAEHES